MAGLPEITFAGTLVADPEARFLPNGSAVCNFTVACNDRRFDAATNSWADKGATFLRCSIWRQAAQNVVESLSKGDRVLVTGALRQRSWETEQGEKRSVMEVDVTEVGPSLKWATAKVSKATRTTTDTATSGATSDPWGQPPATNTALSDEPPF